MKQVVEPAIIATVRMQSLERAGSQPDNSTIKGKRLGGLLLRKQRWGLSWTGWFVFIVVLIAAGAVFILNIHPFLAVTARENTKVLVMEGFVHRYAIRVAADEFRNGGYDHVYTTGGPVTGSGGYTWDADTTANVGAGGLRDVGVPAERVQMVPSHVIGRDRTYNSAVALRDWFRQQGLDVKAINVVTESTHARRTWILFQKAFGNGTKVGIISARNPDYEPRRWWRSSDGFRDVMGEVIAYIYVKFLFQPADHAAV